MAEVRRIAALANGAGLHGILGAGVMSVLSAGAAWGGAVTASLVSDRAVVTAGEVFTLGVSLEIEDGWHTYWRNPGDSGAPPRISLTLPAGWEWGGMASVEWPHPKRHSLPGGLVDYIYEGRVALLLPVLVAEGERAGELREIVAEVEWLECDADVCVPGGARVRVEVRTGEQSERGAGAALIEAQRLKAPRVWDAGEVAALWEENALVLRVGTRGSETKRVEFFPFSEGEGSLMPADDGARDWSAKGSEVRVVFDRGEVGNGGIVLGNLVVDRASGEREVWEVRAPAAPGGVGR